jgi:hypothetical protein
MVNPIIQGWLVDKVIQGGQTELLRPHRYPESAPHR